MATMPATISIGENPSFSPANPSRENKMETTKRPRRYNFSLPTFSWGKQRVIPCVKDPSISSKATLPPLPPPKPSPEKEKDKSAVAEIPWKLRKRRADTSSPVGNGSAVGSTAPVVVAKEEKEMRKTKLSVSLTSMEIRDDFLRMKSKKPASRPKKRPKHVDELFPGLWLSEVTPDLYKVDEEFYCKDSEFYQWILMVDSTDSTASHFYSRRWPQSSTFCQLKVAIIGTQLILRLFATMQPDYRSLLISKPQVY